MTAWHGIWAALALLALGLAIFATVPAPWLWPPAEVQLPFAAWLSAGMKWLTESAAIGPVTVKDLTRGFARIIEAPYDLARILLVEGITEGKGRSVGWRSP
jgi:glycine betaine/proline transport system permease protein